MYHPWDTNRGEERGGGGEAGLLPASNDETDGLQRDEDARGKGVVRVPVPARKKGPGLTKEA